MNKKTIKKRIAIIGTNGIPARYGGFETLAEYLTKYLESKFDFYVYCSNLYKRSERQKTYNGARLIYIPFRGNGIQSFIYDLFCFIHALFKTHTILYLGVTPSGIITSLNGLFKRRIIVNHGGLNEWEREKYSPIEKKWAKINHKHAAKRADLNISDNTILQKSIYKNFHVESIVIRYGGNHSLRIQSNQQLADKYPFTKNKYYLCVARAQIDNNLHLLIDAFNNLEGHQLVIVSNWEISNYGLTLKKKYHNKLKNIILLDAIYNREDIDFLRSNCHLYIHSHSYCGTSPSLVEAMSLNIPVICFNVPTNRETTQESTYYFSNENELRDLIKSLDQKKMDNIRQILYKIAQNNYTWEKVSEKYSKIL
jgi:glycosyltransferase involved in cell wall biosynthesis